MLQKIPFKKIKKAFYKIHRYKIDEWLPWNAGSKNRKRLLVDLRFLFGLKKMF